MGAYRKSHILFAKFNEPRVEQLSAGLDMSGRCNWKIERQILFNGREQFSERFKNVRVDAPGIQTSNDSYEARSFRRYFLLNNFEERRSYFRLVIQAGSRDGAKNLITRVRNNRNVTSS